MRRRVRATPAIRSWTASAPTPSPSSPAGRTYAFQASGTYDLDPDPVTGNKRHATVDFTARVGRHGRARGTFEATIDVVDASGQQVDTCTTGKSIVTWTARLHKS